jgi:hypothetical protein
MNNFTHLKEWIKLSDETKLNIYTETGRQFGLAAMPVEKDWWVMHTLSLVFTMECAPSLIFKGGTSLSKGWNLIKRFSEDIDLVLDKEYLGFSGIMGKGDIHRLRRESYKFLTTVFTDELKAKFLEVGLTDVKVKYLEVVNHDQDPMIIEIYYPKLTEKDSYLKPGVQIEVGCRSLKEPNSARTFSSMVAEKFSGRSFIDEPITIPTVNPERTYLEKIFLLHEEFQRPAEKIRVERLSRHLYDIEKLSKTEYARTAFQDADLFNTIVAHRSKFSPVSGVDYINHRPEKISFVPPTHLLPEWEADYKKMYDDMIYDKEKLLFPELIKKLTELQTQINKINWDRNQKKTIKHDGYLARLINFFKRILTIKKTI